MTPEGTHPAAKNIPWFPNVEVGPTLHLSHFSSFAHRRLRLGPALGCFVGKKIVNLGAEGCCNSIRATLHDSVEGTCRDVNLSMCHSTGARPCGISITINVSSTQAAFIGCLASKVQSIRLLLWATPRVGMEKDCWKPAATLPMPTWVILPHVNQIDDLKISEQSNKHGFKTRNMEDGTCGFIDVVCFIKVQFDGYTRITCRS